MSRYSTLYLTWRPSPPGMTDLTVARSLIAAGLYL